MIDSVKKTKEHSRLRSFTFTSLKTIIHDFFVAIGLHAAVGNPLFPYTNSSHFRNQNASQNWIWTFDM